MHSRPPPAVRRPSAAPCPPAACPRAGEKAQQELVDAGLLKGPITMKRSELVAAKERGEDTDAMQHQMAVDMGGQRSAGS